MQPPVVSLCVMSSAAFNPPLSDAGSAALRRGVWSGDLSPSPVESACP